jgi:hypothetical protein
MTQLRKAVLTECLRRGQIANRINRRSGHHLLPLAAHCWHTSTLLVRRALREQGRI